MRKKNADSSFATSHFVSSLKTPFLACLFKILPAAQNFGQNRVCLLLWESLKINLVDLKKGRQKIRIFFRKSNPPPSPRRENPRSVSGEYDHLSVVIFIKLNCSGKEKLCNSNFWIFRAIKNGKNEDDNDVTTREVKKYMRLYRV